MRFLVAVVLLALLAGCTEPPSSPPTTPASSVTPGPTYDVAVLVTQETADGVPLVGAEVVAYHLDPAGETLTGVAVPASTNGQGVARFSFREPVRLALRATMPGWTQEGTTVAVGEQVVVGGGLVASDRDVFLPLFRTELRIATAMTLATATVVPDAMGGVERPQATVDLALPDRVAAAYLARLASAAVRLAWSETATEHADLAAGLAWDGRLWVAGEASGPAALPGDRSATFSGALPPEGRPADLAAATLQAAAVTNTAVLGDIPLAVEVTLRFAGRVPAGLPSACHSSSGLCLPALPPIDH